MQIGNVNNDDDDEVDASAKRDEKSSEPRES